MQRWRFLDEEWEDPYFNMAVEEAIARSVGEGKAPNTIRFWRNPCAVVLGKFQQVSGEVNLRACQKWKACVVRRFTGGGAVYHDPGNLNYSVSMRGNFLDPLSTHRMSGNGVIEALESFGVKAKFGENTVWTGDRKISGMAGLLGHGICFHHGSLLVNSDIRRLTEVLNPYPWPTPAPDPRSRGVKSKRVKVTSLKDQLGREVPITAVKIPLKRGFERSYNVDLVRKKLTGEEEALAEELYENRYKKDEWNLLYA
jgi:lipoate-protein ligase A